MIKAFLFLCAATIVSTFGQGVIRFETDLRPDVDAPVVLNGGTLGPGPEFSAQLFLYTDGTLTPLSPATNFRAAGSGIDAAADRYVNPVDVAVPDHPPGSNVTLVMRVWRTSAGSYDNAGGCDRGQSDLFAVTLGGGELPPGLLSGLRSFILGNLGCFPPSNPIIAAISVQNAQVTVTGIFTRDSARLQGSSDLRTWANLQATIAVTSDTTRTFTAHALETCQYYRLVE